MSLLDSLFGNHPGPVFLKESGEAEFFVERMKGLSAKATGELKEKIDEQIRYAEAGILGERQIIFELKNSGIDLFAMHDIFLECDGLSAQIDFLLTTRRHIIVIECKNLFGNIEIDEKGNFVRHINFGKTYRKEGVYSPITQNARHLNVLKHVRAQAKTNVVSKMIFEKFFDENYKSVVVLANPKTVLTDKSAPREIRDQVIRADQIAAYIKKLDGKSDKADYSLKEMRDIAEYFLNRSVPNKSDYAAKYEALLKEIDTAGAPAVPEAPEVEPDNPSVVAPAASASEESRICPRCGKPLVLRTAKKGEYAGNRFYGCSGYPKCRFIDVNTPLN